jgi:hypothetical protein
MRSTGSCSPCTEHRVGRGLWLVSLLALLVLQPACALFSSSGSFSDSSDSISESVGSSSDSSKSSSGDEDQAYQEDVRGYTKAAVAAGESPEALRRGVTEIALERGVSDWEAIDSTWRAVGEGLAAASLTSDQRARYRAALAAPDSPQDHMMQAAREVAAAAQP